MPFATFTHDGAVALLALSSLGLTCSLPVLIANTLIARLRRPPARFVRARASLSAAQAACLGAFALHPHHHPPSSSSFRCSYRRIQLLLSPKSSMKDVKTYSA